MVTTAKTIRKDSNLLYLVLCLVSCVLCLAQLTNTTTAATYYLDKNGSDDANGLSVGTAWRTLSKAQSTVIGGDTVVMRNGNYGQWKEQNVSHNDWITYKAEEGHNPIVSQIIVSGFPAWADAHIIFDGLTIQDVSGNTYAAVCLSYVRNVQLLNSNIVGLGYLLSSANHPGIWVRLDGENITIDNCKIYGSGDTTLSGFNTGIWVDESINVNITNSDISECALGIYVDGKSTESKNITISDCNVHKLSADGIVFKDVNNFTIEDSKLHNLVLYVPTLVETTTDTIWDVNGKVMVNSSAMWNTPGDTLITTGMEIVAVFGTNALLGDGEQYGGNFAVSSVDANGHKITLSKGIANGGQPSNVNYYIKASTHSDLIQANVPTVGDYNVIIRRNQLYDELDAWSFMHLNPAGAAKGNNFLIENNLCWNAYTDGNQVNNHPLNLQSMNGAIFRNNTVIGKVHVTGNIANTVIFKNNIISTIDLYADSGIIEGEDYDIINSGRIYAPYTLGGHSTAIGNVVGEWITGVSWNNAQFASIFADYANGDFRHASATSLGVGHGDPMNSPLSDILGNSRSFPPDAGCYEYGSPTANAGPDQRVFDNDNNGIERVTLNGSGSHDSDGTIVSYRWTENGSQIATGVAPTVSLALGAHVITLTVTDDNGATGSDIVAIVVNSPPASDTTAPSIIYASASQSSVEVLFSEPVERASAENIANYSINNGVSIISISLNSDLNRTTLLTTKHTDRATYTLTISNVRDLAGNAMTPTTINYSYNEGLVGYWAFDDGAGISAADSSGNSNTGVLVNGPLWHQLCPGQNALNFDGTDDYVNCGNGSTLNLTGSLTISAWINPEDFGQSGWGRIVDKGNSSAGYSFFLDNDTRSIAYVTYGGNIVKANPDTITLNTWQHVAAVYDNLSGTVSFYVDGLQTGSSQYTTPPASSSNFNLTIGNRGYDLSKAFHGLLDDVRVYNRALPADEILNLSTALLPIGDKEVKEGSTLTFEVVTRVPDMVVDINGHNLPSEPSFSSNIFSWRPSIGQAGRYEITFEAQHGDIVDFETITVTVTSNVSLTDGLVGYWKMNDYASNITVADSSILNIDGKAKKYTSALSTIGKLNGALNFNGTTDYISLADINTFDSAATPMTIAMWVKPTKLTATPYQMLFDKLDETSPMKGFSFGAWQTTGTISFSIKSDNWLQVRGSTALPNNSWSFVAVTYDGSKRANGVTLYVNGKAESKIVFYDSLTADDISNTISAQLGARKGANYPFAGAMDNVMVFNRALSQQEIGSLYNTGEGMELGANHAPVLSPIGDKPVYENCSISFSVAASDADGDTLTYTAQNLPAGAVFSGNTFTWTPTSGQTGTHQVTFIVSDGTRSDSETITITVTSNASLTEGLAGYWQMNDSAADTTVADSGPNGDNGTAQRYTSALSTTGKLNNALTFNGISDYVSLSDFNAPDSATEPMTIAMWVKPANFTATAYQMLFDKLDCTAPIKGFSLGAWQTTGTISFSMRSNNWLQVHGSSALSNNTWSFVAVTYDGSKSANGVTLYVNGKAETKIVFCDSLTADDISNTISAQLGAREGNNYPFSGVMDDVMFYNRALSQQEISSLYNNGEGIELGANHAPVLSPIGDKSVYENCSISFSVAGSDADDDTLTYTAQNLPAGAVFSGNTFTWTPTSGQTGTHQVTFIVSDGTRSDSETITITVTSNASLTDGLVGYWKMNDYASNITVADSSILNIDGKAKKYTSALSTIGKLNGALNFNGTTDYISLADINTFDSAATPMTIAMWVKPTKLTATPYQMLFDKLDETSPMKGFSFGAWQTTGTISFSIKSDNWLQVRGSTALPNNSWSFVAVTYDGSKRANGVTLYVNGKAESKIVFYDSLTADDISNTISAQLGARKGANYPFAGAMDNVMVFNRALSQQEITTLYNSGSGTEIE